MKQLFVFAFLLLSAPTLLTAQYKVSVIVNPDLPGAIREDCDSNFVIRVSNGKAKVFLQNVQITPDVDSSLKLTWKVFIARASFRTVEDAEEYAQLVKTQDDYALYLMVLPRALEDLKRDYAKPEKTNTFNDLIQ